MSVSRKDNESAPNLYIEFEADDEAEHYGEPRLVSEPEAVGRCPRSLLPRWAPGWAWGSVPVRYRKAVAGAVVLLGLSGAFGDALVAQAAQRAADRPAVTVIDAAYSARVDGSGLDLLVNLGDPGPADFSVTQARVRQPGVDLRYGGPPLSLRRSDQLELVLSGSYDCVAASNPSAPAESVVQLTVRSVHGTVTSLDLRLPESARLPGHWRGGRTAAYCAWNR